MSRMHNPPHPGEVLRDGVFANTGLTVSDFARHLGVTRVALSRVLNGRAAISADMAVRLAAALGGSAESWLHMQADYDLWQVRRLPRARVARILGARARPASSKGTPARRTT
jgi:addiction module HigA family antidote